MSFSFSRGEIGAVSALALLAFAGAASAAEQPSLSASASAGACGGSVSCYFTDSQAVQPAAANASAAGVMHSTMPDGSYADAAATSSFGALHVSADAYRAPLGTYGDAQSSATAEFIELFSGQQIGGGVYHLDFTVDGTHTPNNGLYGVDNGAYVSYSVADTSSNASLANGFWQSTDAQPDLNLLQDIAVAAGHGIRLQVDFTAHAYTINYTYTPDGTYPVAADYSHTLVANFYAGNGDGLVGESGHDYGLPGGAVPEPAAWAIMVLGFGAAGAALRQRRRVLAA